MAASARCLANQPRIKCDTFARCRRATGPCRTLEPRAQPFPVAADAGRLSWPDRRLQTCAVLLRFWPQPCCWLWASLPRRRALQPRPLPQRAWRQRQVRGGARAEAALCSYTPPPACGPSSSRRSRFGWFRHSPRHTLAPSGTLARCLVRCSEVHSVNYTPSLLFSCCRARATAELQGANHELGGGRCGTGIGWLVRRWRCLHIGVQLERRGVQPGW